MLTQMETTWQEKIRMRLKYQLLSRFSPEKSKLLSYEQVLELNFRVVLVLAIETSSEALKIKCSALLLMLLAIRNIRYKIHFPGRGMGGTQAQRR